MMRLRESKYMEAVLNARAEIIRFVRTDLSVDNRVTLPDTGLETKLDKEVKALQTELEKAKAHGLKIPVVYNTGGYEKSQSPVSRCPSRGGSSKG